MLDLTEQIAKAICALAPRHQLDGLGQAYAVLAAIDRAGYAIVPREPTEAMVTAGDWHTITSVRDIWQRMIEVAAAERGDQGAG